MGRPLQYRIQTRLIWRELLGKHHYWSGRAAQFHDMRQLGAGHSGQRIISDQQIVNTGVEYCQRFFCAAGGLYSITEVVEKPLCHDTVAVPGLNHQYRSPGSFSFVLHNTI